jgi:hypothetical protein
MGSPTDHGGARMNFVNDEIKVVPRVRTLPDKQERIVDILVEIIWYGSIIGLFILGSIAIKQKVKEK